MHRRDLLRYGAATVAASLQPALLSAAASGKPGSVAGSNVEQWGIFEVSLPGPSGGNPYKDVTLTARFTMEHRSVQVTGFYDGGGVYRARFMPDMRGRWSYETQSSARELAGHTGEFVCTPPTTPGNHGPVGTAHQFHFQYADGTPYFPFGTTCYSYGFIGESLERLTLEALKEAGFNKMRMCLLPKPLGERKPVAMPFERIGAEAAEALKSTMENSEEVKSAERY